MKTSVLALAVMSAIAGATHAAEEGRAQTPAAPTACTSIQDFRDTDCTLTWYGVTLYGAYDVGVGWVSHGLPENGHNYEGEALVIETLRARDSSSRRITCRKRVWASGAG